MVKDLRINRRIRAREVRVIGPDGDQLGIINFLEALKTAEGHGLDLVEVAPEAQPPVCRIMDYGKYRYQQKKKSQGSKKKQAVVVLKEIKFHSRTDAHDRSYKVRSIRRFIEEGDRVRVSVYFRGREIAHPELGRVMLEGVISQVSDIAKVEVPPKMEGRSMAMFLAKK